MAEEFYSSGNTGLKYLNWRAHLSISIAAKVYRQIGVQILKKNCSWFDWKGNNFKINQGILLNQSN